MRAGQQPQNPLLLLGQYSDDELDDDSNQVLSNAAVGNSSPENNDEVIKGILYFLPCPMSLPIWSLVY